MYWFGKQRRKALGLPNASGDDTTAGGSGLLDGESYYPQDPDEQPGDPAEIELEEKRWVRREFFCMVLVVIGWITWIIVFQILKDYFPSGWLVRGEDDGELTGW